MKQILQCLFFISFASLFGQEIETKIEDDYLATITTQSKGKNALVLFPGYSVQQKWAITWAKEMVNNQQVYNSFGKVFISNGPKEVFYESQELSTTKILDQLSKQSYEYIVIVAHSSGSFPTHVFLNQWLKQDSLRDNYLNKLIYINLDGAIGENQNQFPKEAVKLLKKGVSVSVKDSKTASFSSNHDSMVAFANQYPDNFNHMVLTLDTGCDADAKWCLHDAVINLKPHNPKTFDLESDYSIFNKAHPINLIWMEEVLKLIN